MPISYSLSFANTRKAGRFATGALAAVLLLLTIFSLWVTMSTRAASEAVRDSTQHNDAYDEAGSAVASEESLERKYRLEPSAEVRAAHQLAGQNLIDVLNSTNAASDEQDRSFVQSVLADHEKYLRATRRLFAAVDAGNTALALSIDNNEVDPVFSSISLRINTAVEQHHQEALASLATLTSTQNFFVLATPIVFGIGLVLLVVFWAVLTRYQRNVDQSRMREAAVELEIVKSTAEAEQRILRESSERFRALVQNSTDIIMVVDLQGILHYRGPSVEHVLGPFAITARTTDIFQLLLPGERDNMAHFLTQIPEVPGQHMLGEFFAHGADGNKLYLEVIGTYLVCDPMATDKILSTPGMIVLNARDASERKRAEESRTAMEAAKQANRAKSEFLSHMSHELRTPLNSILGFGQLLQSSEISSTQRTELNYIVTAGEQLLRLIDGLLDIASIEAGKMKFTIRTLPVEQVIAESMALVGPIAAQREIQLHVGTETVCSRYVRADSQRVTQVLLNLLSNAIKYNHQGGRVTITYEELPLCPTMLGSLAGLEGSGKMRINVTDTGPGITSRQVAKLFQPFERLGEEEGSVEGTGLGLTLSKALMEAMDGALGVSSIAGVGSTFWIELPIFVRKNNSEQLANSEIEFSLVATA